MSGVRIGETGTWWEHDDRGLLWARNGQVALEGAPTRELAEEFIRRFESGDQFWCAGHQRWESTPHAASRFAGQYCGEAWETYKAANSRECRMCRRPIYDCYC